MNDDFKDKKGAGAAAEPPDAGGTGGPGALKSPFDGAPPEDRAATLQRELDEARSRLLRATADYQNMVRRTQQSAQEARDQQLLEVCRSLVGVLDHFDRALEVDVAKVPVQNVIQGVKIVRDELNKMLEGFGMRRIETKPGDEFDPSRHEAMLHQAVEGVPKGHVAAQLQPGYALGERTLRPAKVSIAS